MHVFVYKSLRKADTYLYLREKDAFGVVPDAVTHVFLSHHHPDHTMNVAAFFDLGALNNVVMLTIAAIKASAIAREAGAQYVKTSTGFHAAGGASAEAVALMRLVVGDGMGVKASGGVRDCATALRMIANGATRIGTSSGVAMAQCLGRGPLPLGELLASPDLHADRSQRACMPPPGAPIHHWS